MKNIIVMRKYLELLYLTVTDMSIIVLARNQRYILYEHKRNITDSTYTFATAI